MYRFNVLENFIILNYDDYEMHAYNTHKNTHKLINASL